MKKLLVAVAIAAFASTTYAALSGSAHDLNVGTYTAGKTSSCLYCHVAHRAVSNVAPLWARNSIKAQTAYTKYSQTTVLVTDLDPRGTLTCLSCHETGTAADMGTGASIPGGSLAILTNNLGDDHPVGTGTLFSAGTGGFQPASIAILGGVTVPNGKIECTTCHTVHNASAQGGTAPLLWSYAGVDFCVVCHNK